MAERTFDITFRITARDMTEKELAEEVGLDKGEIAECLDESGILPDDIAACIAANVPGNDEILVGSDMTIVLTACEVISVAARPHKPPALEDLMTDLIEELRSRSNTAKAMGSSDVLLENAANEIERLRTVIFGLLGALGALCDAIEGLEEHGGGAHEDECPVCVAIANARELSQ